MSQISSDRAKVLCTLSDKLSNDASLLQLMGKLYEYGVELNYEKVAGSVCRQDQFLPPYPFEGDRYWIDIPSLESMSQSRSSNHLPGIEHKLPQTQDRHFTAQLRTDALSYYSDHCINDIPVLPGAAYLSIAHALLKRIGKSRCSIEKVNLRAAMRLNQDWQIESIVKPDNRIEIWSVNEHDNNWCLNAEMSFDRVPENQQVEVCAEQSEFRYFKSASADLRPLDVSAHYKACAEHRLQYGLAFQGIESLGIRGNSVFAKVKLEEIDAGEFSHLHPCLIDTVFQTGFPLLPDDAMAPGYLPLPVGVERMRSYDDLPSEFYVIASKETGGDLAIDYKVLSIQGRLLLEINQLKLKKTLLADVAQEDSGDCFYLPVWKRTPNTAELNTAGSTLLVYSSDAHGLCKSLSKIISLESCPIHKFDTNFDVSKYDSIVYMGHFYFPVPKQSYDESGLEKLLYLLKNTQGSLKIVGNFGSQFNDSEPCQPITAACYGLASTLPKENSTTKHINIDLSLVENANEDELDVIAEKIANEVPVAGGTAVVYRENNRYARELNKLVFEPSHGVSFRLGGTYLIVGGAGGIGYKLSQYLAEHYNANLIWIGRKQVEPEKIEKIQLLGGKLRTYAVDVTDEKAVSSIVADIKTQFKTLNGVVHSAVVLKDKLIANISVQDMKDCLAPKTKGSSALFNAVRGESLDFMLFFSSANSFVANAGQGNYVAACCFKDAFAQYVHVDHGIPTKVINWGYWGEVGVVSGEDYQRRMESLGVKPITTEHGMEAIEKVLKSDIDRAIYFNAKPSLLKQFGFDDKTSYAQQGNSDVEIEGAIHECIGVTKSSIVEYSGPVNLNEGYSALNQFARELICSQVPDSSLLSGNSVLQAVQGFYGSHAVLSFAELQNKKTQLLESYPWISHELNLLWECGKSLPDIVTGKKSATEVIFPNLSMSLVEGVYGSGPASRYANEQLAWAVAELASRQESSVIKILEIGAGTGGTTDSVLEHLALCGKKIEYVYTDISPAFLQHGQEKFAKSFPWVEYKTFDVEQSPPQQGFESGNYDIVLAANVLHATVDISSTLQNVKRLLRKGGVLVLNELCNRQDFLTLTFGLLDGWWLSSDQYKRIPNSPLLNPSMWKTSLLDEGFVYAGTLKQHHAIENQALQKTILSVSDGFALVGEAQQFDSMADSVSDHEFEKVSEDNVLAEVGLSDESRCRELLISFLRWELVDILRLDAEKVFRTRQPFPKMLLSELGLDSLTAMELRNDFKKKLDVDIPIENLLGGEKIDLLISQLYEQLLLKKLVVSPSAEKEGASEGAEMEELVI